MALYILAYDVRAKNHDYKMLYVQLNAWRAAHLQDSVWLASVDGTALAVRDAMMAHMHKDDTACVIQLEPKLFWATQNAQPEGIAWLKANLLA
jgi:CRISPR/Cas system-associated endoribonuclease Cas2